MANSTPLIAAEFNILYEYHTHETLESLNDFLFQRIPGGLFSDLFRIHKLTGVYFKVLSCLNKPIIIYLCMFS